MEGWHVKIPGILLDNTYRAFPLGLYDRQPLECWHKGRVVVCGDAAHPTTPLGAQVSYGFFISFSSLPPNSSFATYQMS